ncbi:exonuclease domain-containing protein [Olivibacter sitiensis]|uniref:exonuclease domain-containing protein n=1 Tax=Olivibacter sitiensis TaxID=376470 RepID=UPI00040F1570|nr:exonuclease domain-containing protein [Olivibacter sitiensis]
MEYAIVDIETTGGHPAGNGMTEIAIVIHDGKQIIDSFESLINPLQPIPLHITALTGIHDEMVAQSPTFIDIAAQVFNILNDRVFVAHNVNFDYSFVKHQLKEAGYEYNATKLCTVRMSRKVFPGHPSYSLGRLCRTLGIAHSNAHRAMGDAKATVCLFSRLLENDVEGHIAQMLKKNSKEQALPAHLNREEVEALPQCPGVYYFKDKSAKVIYVGKAKNIKKRVLSHFSGLKTNAQRQQFLKHIHSIDHTVCGTELMAIVLEATEIKRLWPLYNRAIKQYEPKFGLYTFTDQNGYQRMVVDHYKKNQAKLWMFNRLSEGTELLKWLCQEFNLCPKMNFLQQTCAAANGCACRKELSTVSYNLRVKQAIQSLEDKLPSFAIIDKGRNDHEQSCIWVEQGQLFGMGYYEALQQATEPSAIKSLLTPYNGTDYIMRILVKYAKEYPHHVIPIEKTKHKISHYQYLPIST